MLGVSMQLNHAYIGFFNMAGLKHNKTSTP